jgi:hypothetical protein
VESGSGGSSFKDLPGLVGFIIKIQILFN